jgi:hypothetical protein
MHMATWLTVRPVQHEFCERLQQRQASSHASRDGVKMRNNIPQSGAAAAAAAAVDMLGQQWWQPAGVRHDNSMPVAAAVAARMPSSQHVTTVVHVSAGDTCSVTLAAVKAPREQSRCTNPRGLSYTMPCSAVLL